eukprot:4771084-Amphidinium_carterae.1
MQARELPTAGFPPFSGSVMPPPDNETTTTPDKCPTSAFQPAVLLALPSSLSPSSKITQPPRG